MTDKKIVVVMPAYNAEKTISRTYAETMETGIVDTIIIVDDASNDRTAMVAKSLPGVIFEQHPSNRGYGANQKTCYRLALANGADVVVMVHPDYQYTPRLIPAMAHMLTSGLYDCVLGSRILGGGALQGGMPLWRYIPNRALTAFQNLCTGAKLSEYHTGYRAFSREALLALDCARYSDDFLFDAQILMQILAAGFRVGEVSCPTKYFPEASSINFRRSLIYGFGCLVEAMNFAANRRSSSRSSS